MFLGQLTINRARKEFRCEFCREPIVPRQKYFSLVIKSHESKLFSRRFHRPPKDCLINHIYMMEARREREVERRREELGNRGGGRPKLNIPDHVKSRRRYLLQKVSVYKGRLIEAYHDPYNHKLDRAKLQLSKHMLELYEDDEYGQRLIFKFPEALMECYANGLDKSISMEELMDTNFAWYNYATLLRDSCGKV